MNLTKLADTRAFLGIVVEVPEYPGSTRPDGGAISNPVGKASSVVVVLGERRDLPAGEISVPGEAKSRPPSYERSTRAHFISRSPGEDAISMRVWVRWTACLQAVKSYKNPPRVLFSNAAVVPGSCIKPWTDQKVGVVSDQYMTFSPRSTPLQTRSVLCRNLEDWITKISSAILSQEVVVLL